MCWWFFQWLIQNKIQGCATQQENQRWDDKLIAIFFSLRILLGNYSKCFLIILLCFEVAKHLCEWPETLLCSFRGLTRALKEVAARLTPKEHNRQVGPSLLTWGQMSSFFFCLIFSSWGDSELLQCPQGFLGMDSVFDFRSLFISKLNRNKTSSFPDKIKKLLWIKEDKTPGV